MSAYKTILAPLEDGERGSVALAMALSTAKIFAAHVTVAHLGADASAIVPLVGEGMPGQVIEDLINSAEKDVARRAEAARALFETARAAAGVPLVDIPEPDEQASCAYAELVGTEQEVARQGALCDLIVIARPDSHDGASGNLTFNAALMESGRPVLVAPDVDSLAFGTNVAIAWNGSAEASRAVFAAMPFLKKAEKVTIFGSADLQGLVDYLAWHDIKAQTQTLPEGADVGTALLEGVAALKADLLVMGAYTHSRLRQLFFGGVTHHVLESVSIPVLMMH